MSTTIDINVTPIVEEVTINTVENVTIINVNSFSGVIPTLQQVTQAGANTTISPVIPAGTLTGHAVNKGQLDLKADQATTYTMVEVDDLISNSTPTLQQVLNNNHDLVDGNNFQGTSAGVNNTGVNVNANGLNSAVNNQGNNVNANGIASTLNNIGSNVNANGLNSAQSNQGINVNANGKESAFNNSGNNVNANGYRSGTFNTFNNVNLFGTNSRADADNQTVFSKDGESIAVISYNNITGFKKVELPNKDGTFAYLDDLVTDPNPTDGSTNAVSSNGVFDALALKENTANKGINNGYAPLDSGGKIPLANLPSTLLKYQGVWNATTNTPTLTNPDLTKVVNVYNVSVAGTRFGITWNLGDWLIYNASGVPEKSDNSDDVVSVNGQTGVVTLTTADLADTLNKRYVNDAQKTVITNTSGTNTGDQNLSNIMEKSANGADIENIATFRRNLGVDKLTSRGNSNYTILSTDKAVVTSATFTAPRTFTLPLANTLNAGYEIIVADLFGGVTSTNTLTVSISGSDTVNNVSSAVIGATFGMRRFITDGFSKWTFDAGVMRVSDYIGTTLTANKNVITDANGKLTNGIDASFVDFTSSGQTQLNAKAPIASPTFTGTVTLTGLLITGGFPTSFISGNGAAANFSNTVRATILGPIVAGTNTPITSSNNFIVLFQNIQAQISARVDQGVNNATTIVLTSAQLTTAYPSATTGFRVYCTSIVAGAMVYEKTPTQWIGTTVMTP